MIRMLKITDRFSFMDKFIPSSKGNLIFSKSKSPRPSLDMVFLLPYMATLRLASLPSKAVFWIAEVCPLKHNDVMQSVYRYASSQRQPVSPEQVENWEVSVLMLLLSSGVEKSTKINRTWSNLKNERDENFQKILLKNASSCERWVIPQRTQSTFYAEGDQRESADSLESASSSPPLKNRTFCSW